MKRFEEIPTYQTAAQIERRTQEAKFGDGYRQTADDGTNADMRSWQVAFQNVRSSKAARIRAFLDDIGSQPFLWKPPAPDNRTILVYAEQPYQHTWEKFDSESISVIFTKCFNPPEERCAAVVITVEDSDVLMACATVGATIYFEMASVGSEAAEPTESSLVYGGPIAPDPGDTYKAIAAHPTKMTSKTTTFIFPL